MFKQKIKDAKTVEELDGVATEIRTALSADTINIDTIRELKEDTDMLTTRMSELTSSELDNFKESIKRGDVKAKTSKATVSNDRVLRSETYAKAYIDYLRNGNSAACRSLLTELANPKGDLPVPTIVAETVSTAWEVDPLFNHISNKLNYRGIYEQPFEVSADGASIHVEGQVAPAEENVVIGVAKILPQTFKKWVTVSDEAIDESAVDVLAYIYREITYRIIKLVSDTAIKSIIDAPATADKEHVAVKSINAKADAGTVFKAFGELSDEAMNPVVICNKRTYAHFKSMLTADGYVLNDPFAGMQVYFNDSLKDYDTATATDPYMIVGDLSALVVTLQHGNDVKIKVDDLSRAESDIVKVVGSFKAGVGLVKSDCFVKVCKGE